VGAHSMITECAAYNHNTRRLTAVCVYGRAMIGVDARPIDCLSRCDSDEHVVVHCDHFKAVMCRHCRHRAHIVPLSHAHFVGDVRGLLSV
jgi:hypothetical protein